MYLNLSPLMLAPKKAMATIVSNTLVAKETYRIVLNIKDPEFIFSPGQFINLFLGEKIIRSYSIASSTHTLPELEMCIKVVEEGKGSPIICSKKKGEEIEIMGPFGHFGEKESYKKLLLIATGTGIAPMKSIIEHHKETNFQKPIHLVFGVRSVEYASYKDQFESLAEKYEHFTFELFVSRPPEEYTGNTGRVTDFINNLKVSNFRDTQVLLCGNPAMIKEAKSLLLDEKKLEKDQVSIEAF